MSFIAVIAVSSSVFGYFSVTGLEKMSLQLLREEIIKQAELISKDAVRSGYSGLDPKELQARIRDFSEATGSRVTLISPSGRVIADSSTPFNSIGSLDDHSSRPELIQAKLTGTGFSTRYSETLREFEMYGAVPVIDRGITVSYVRIALPMTVINGLNSRIEMAVWAGALVSVIIAVLLSLLFSHFISSPIKKLSQNAKALAAGTTPKFSLKRSLMEIGELEKELSEMSEAVRSALDRLKTEKSTLDAVFTGMREGVLVVDRNGRVLSSNPAFRKIFGHSQTGTEGMTAREALRNNEISELIEKAAGASSEMTGTIRLVTPIEAHFDVYVSPMSGGGSICVLHDTTRIETLERYRKEFIANISHELKTPLTSIRSFAELLLSGGLEDRKRAAEFARKIEKHALNLTNLIEDILSLSRLESADSGRDEKRPVALCEALRKTVEDLAPKAEAKNIRLSTDCSVEELNCIEGYLIRAVSNLVDNAINYSGKNGSVEVRASSDDRGNVTISVSDKGIGIPEEALPRIFERFFRVDNARSRELGGTGLGLSIVKHIMELHGGSVTAESVPGSGSTFTLVFPVNN